MSEINSAAEVSQAESEIKAEECRGWDIRKAEAQWRGNTSPKTCFIMSSTPSTSNAVPVPVSVPMEIDSDSDSEVERREKAEVEEAERVAIAARKKRDNAKAERKQRRKEKAATMANVKEAAIQAAEQGKEHLRKVVEEQVCKNAIEVSPIRSSEKVGN